MIAFIRIIISEACGNFNFFSESFCSGEQTYLPNSNMMSGRDV
jgi:hypothetical protein